MWIKFSQENLFWIYWKIKMFLPVTTVSELTRVPPQKYFHFVRSFLLLLINAEFLRAKRVHGWNKSKNIHSHFWSLVSHLTMQILVYSPWTHFYRQSMQILVVQAGHHIQKSSQHHMRALHNFVDHFDFERTLNLSESPQ